MLKKAAAKYKDSPYLTEKTNEGWKSKTFAQVQESTDILAAGLLTFSFQKNDKFAILAEGRTSWVEMEFSVLKIGGISVPLSIKLLPEEVLFRLNHSESKAIILSKNTIDKIFPIWNKIETKNFKIIYLDDDIENLKSLFQKNNIEFEKNVILFSNLFETGKLNLEKLSQQLILIESQITENGIVTISYTSGTTGNPKGIMLSHLNYFSNSNDALTSFRLPEFYKLLIILPIDHSFAHTVGTYIALLHATQIYFVDARGGNLNMLKNIPANLREISPDFLLTVPAITGSFMKKIVDTIDDKGGFVKWLFHSGMKSGMKINNDGFRKADFLTKLIHFPIYKFANALIFKKVRKIFGENLKFCVGGGALLDIKQQRFFYTLGVPVLQGYGLTEASPIISANAPYLHKLGTSGPVLQNIECKILKSDGKEAKINEKGEIAIRSNSVMKGYFRNQKATDEVLKEGFLYTGDMGFYDNDNFLVVTGREKALLISQDGEKYSPEEIEEAITNSSNLILQTMIYNDHKKFTTALITLNLTKISALIKKNEMQNAEMLLSEIKNSFYSFKNETEYQNVFPEKWIPTFFRILQEPFTEQNFMINSTMKMVRYKIVENYKNVIEEMYNENARNLTNSQNIEVLKKLFF